MPAVPGVINNGVVSKWLASKPSVTEMLTVDSNGNVQRQAIPSVASAVWGGITGTLSNQTDLENRFSAVESALASKADSSSLANYLPLAGGTLTGLLSGTNISLTGNLTVTSDEWFGLGSNNSRFVPRTGGARIYSGSAMTFQQTGSVTDILTDTLNARNLFLRNAANAMRMELYGTYTDASNYRRLYISSTTAGAFTLGVEGLGTGASGNTLTIANAVTFGGSITGAQIITNTNGFQTPIGGNGYAFNSGGYFICSSNGVFKFSNWADNDFGRLQLGGTTSSFPSIKRNGTAINFRLADDSADAPITTEAITASGVVSGLRLLTTTGDVRASGSQLIFLTNNTTERMRIDASGNVGIGATNPNVGLVIRRSGTDLPALRLEDGDITVPFTGAGFNPALGANTIGAWGSSASTSGGMTLAGFTNNTAAAYPLTFLGYHGSASPTNPAVQFSGNKTNGSTGSTALASTELIAGFYNGDVGTTPVVTIAGSGTITAPSMYLAGTSSNIGVEYDADGVRLKAYSGSALMYITTTGGGVRIAGTREFGWVSDANSANSGTFDTKLVRDAANTVAQRNGTTAQASRTYQSYTDASNYHRWKVDFSGSTCRFGTERAGTGATGNMELWQNGGAIIGFNSGGKIFFHNRDITFGYWNGGNVSLRQASAFSGILDLVDALSHSTYLALSLGNLIVGGAPATTTTRIKNTSGTMNFRLGNDSADCNITAAEALFSGSVKFSGSTSAEPMLKRSGSTIQVRLADDSGFGGMAASTGSFGSTVTIGAYTLPATDGTNGQVLTTNGSGSVTWQASGGGGGGSGVSASFAIAMAVAL